MSNIISSRTPEGSPNICHVCGAKVRIEPSSFPRHDAPCPQCGTLLVFEAPDELVFSMKNFTPKDLIKYAQIGIKGRNRKQIYFDFKGVDDIDEATIESIIMLDEALQIQNHTVRFINFSKEIEEIYKVTKVIKSL